MAAKASRRVDSLADEVQEMVMRMVTTFPPSYISARFTDVSVLDAILSREPSTHDIDAEMLDLVVNMINNNRA